MISSVAIGRAAAVDASSGSADALTAGFQLAVGVAAGLTVVGALVALLVLRPAERQAVVLRSPAPSRRD